MRRTAAVILGATVVCWTAAPALAAPGDPITGYWARTRTGLPVPLQPPDPVPEGGTWVASDPTGPVAVSALRTDLPTGLVAVELRLSIADARGTPAVQVCPSTDRWSPEQGGRLDGAPQGDCAAPLDAKVDGEVLVVPLPPGMDAVNVLLRPKPGSAFSLTMKRATAGSVVTATAPFVAPPPTSADPPATGSSSDPSFAAAPPAFFPPALDLSAQVPLVAAPVLPAPAAARPAPAPQAAPSPVASAVAAPRAAVDPNDRPQALLAVAVLALLAVQAVRLARQPAVAPQVLGGAARRSRPAPTEVPVGSVQPARGVGRFRGVRTAPPVRI